MHKARDTSGNAGSSNVIGSLKYWSKCFSEKSANLPALWKAFETLKLFASLSSCVWLHSKKARSTSLPSFCRYGAKYFPRNSSNYATAQDDIASVQ